MDHIHIKTNWMCIISGCCIKFLHLTRNKPFSSSSNQNGCAIITTSSLNLVPPLPQIPQTSKSNHNIQAHNIVK